MEADRAVIDEDGVHSYAVDRLPAASHASPKLRDRFADRFPWVTSPSDGLKLLDHFGYQDGQDLILCLEMLYPELVKARNLLETQLEVLNRFAGHTWTVAEKGRFWFSGFFETCSALSWNITLFRPPSVPFNSSTQRQMREEACRNSHAVRKASHELIARLADVKEPLILRANITEQLGRLDEALSDSEQWFDERVEAAEQREAELSRNEASQNNSFADNGLLLAPMPGVNRTGSASSGIFAPTATGLTQKNRQAKRQDTHYAQAFQGGPADSRFHRFISSSTHKLKGAWRSVTDAVGVPWHRFRQKPFTTRLGHKITICTLISLISLASAASTALAVCEAGPNTSLPQIDSNFYSTLSQNLLSGAGLYCIIIPILLKVNPNVQNPSLFYGFLVASAVGTLVSTLVYMVHTRTSMVMAYVAALLQLLATLQLILAQGTKVKRLQVNVEMLEGQIRDFHAQRE